MKFRSGIALCALVVGLSSLTLCQPPRPRIVRIQVPPFPMANNVETKDIPPFAEELLGSVSNAVPWEARALNTRARRTFK